VTSFESTGELRSAFRAPGQGALAKQLDHLDEHCRAFIAHAPFLVLATAGGDGSCDASPRGGPPGFVRVIDDLHLAVPDLSGNNRLDSLANVVETGGVGLLFLVPGVGETLRVNGRGRVERLDEGSIHLVVTVEQAFLHCAKSLRRASLWQPEAWPDTSGMPSPAQMLRDQVAPDRTAEQISAALERDYAETLWDPSRTAD
jgi:uncharacterized protein